jgi:hypothetical protein
MRKQKPRNALVTQDSDFTDLGVLNMIPISSFEEDDSKSDIENVRLEILEPKNWVTRNKIIVRNS